MLSLSWLSLIVSIVDYSTLRSASANERLQMGQFRLLLHH